MKITGVRNLWRGFGSQAIPGSRPQKPRRRGFAPGWPCCCGETTPPATSTGGPVGEGACCCTGFPARPSYIANTSGFGNKSGLCTCSTTSTGQSIANHNGQFILDFTTDFSENIWEFSMPTSEACKGANTLRLKVYATTEFSGGPRLCYWEATWYSTDGQTPFGTMRWTDPNQTTQSKFGGCSTACSSGVPTNRLTTTSFVGIRCGNIGATDTGPPPTPGFWDINFATT